MSTASIGCNLADVAHFRTKKADFQLLIIHHDEHSLPSCASSPQSALVRTTLTCFMQSIGCQHLLVAGAPKSRHETCAPSTNGHCRQAANSPRQEALLMGGTELRQMIASNGAILSTLNGTTWKLIIGTRSKSNETDVKAVRVRHWRNFELIFSYRSSTAKLVVTPSGEQQSACQRQLLSLLCVKKTKWEEGRGKQAPSVRDMLTYSCFFLTFRNKASLTWTPIQKSGAMYMQQSQRYLLPS